MLEELLNGMGRLRSTLDAVHPWLTPAAGLLVLLIAVTVVDIVARRRLKAIARMLARQTAARWDDAFVEYKVFARLAHLVTAAAIYFGVNLVPGLGTSPLAVIQNVAVAYGVLSIVRSVSAALSAINHLYESGGHVSQRPIKGYVQVLKIILYCVGAILMISALIDKSPVILLSGFGAMTAVLLLVFKDTILSLVASVQLGSLDMIRVGDWIEMPQLNADGDVIDVALHTVRVQNWDKTITTIPTHKLISESFMNWRGMQDSGGRRIKRSLRLDQRSVRFLTGDEIDRFKRFVLLKEYIVSKQAELDAYNAGLSEHTSEDVNTRKLTNLGTLRAYLINYLRHHPKIHQGMTLLVRQLQPDAEGLPIEVYCFSATTAWADYEAIQADIFDHLLAILPEFGLSVFQSVGGQDLSKMHVGARD